MSPRATGLHSMKATALYAIGKDNMPASPEGIGPEATAMWNALNNDYVFTIDQLAILDCGIRAFERSIQARKVLDSEGVIVTDRFGQRVAHPAANIERQARAQFMQSLSQIGVGFEPPKEPGRPPGITKV